MRDVLDDPIQPGTKVLRVCRDGVPIQITVTGVTPDRIICGCFEYDRVSGRSIDTDTYDIVARSYIALPIPDVLYM